MAEEDKIEDKKEDIKEPDTISAGEQKARDGGWVPQDEWKGEPDAWIAATEFNYRGELMDRISEQSSILHNLKNQVEERNKAIDDLKTVNSKIADREYKRALESLRKQKAMAVDEGEGEKVVEIDEEIDNLKEAHEKAAQPADMATAPNTPKEVVEWLQASENQWYNTDPFLKSVAYGYAAMILKDSPNLAPSEVLKRMERAIRQELPHRFKGRRTTVDDGGGDETNRPGTKPRAPRFADLDDEQKAVCKRFEKLGVMSQKEYIEELHAQGEI